MEDKNEFSLKFVEKLVKSIRNHASAIEDCKCQLAREISLYEEDVQHLQDYLNKYGFSTIDEISEKYGNYVGPDTFKSKKSGILPDDTPLTSTRLTGRCRSIFTDYLNIHTVGELVNYIDHGDRGECVTLYSIRGVGPKTFQKIIRFLETSTSCTSIQEQIRRKERYSL